MPGVSTPMGGPCRFPPFSKPDKNPTFAMKSNTTLLFSAFAAAALLAGCETTQRTRVGRGAFGGSSAERPARIRTVSERPARVRPAVEQPSGVSEQPLAPVQPVVAQPQPVAQQPKPVVAQPQPTTFQPQPVAQQPKTVVAQPQPIVATPQPVAQPQPAAVQAPAAPTFGTYKVKRGDVAGRIANSHGMTLKEFLDANNMTLEQANKLRHGVNVKVWLNQEPLKAGPAVRSAQPAAPDDPNVHVVKAGETLGAISAKTGVPVATLMKLNNIDDPNLIREGRKLILRADAPATAPKTPAVAPVVAPTEAKAEPPAKIRRTTKTPKQPEPAKTAGTAPVVAPPSVPAAPVVPAVAPVREPQDASVPNSEVKVDGTNASVEDLLSGLSLSEAREQAEEKKETAAKQLRDAAAGAADDAPEGYRYYTVQEGESLYRLGARFKVPFKTLRDVNHLPPSTSKLEPGTRLLVPDVEP